MLLPLFYTKLMLDIESMHQSKGILFEAPWPTIQNGAFTIFMLQEEVTTLYAMIYAPLLVA